MKYNRDEILKQFQRVNNIKLSLYTSDMSKLNDTNHYDKYIGKEIFGDSVDNWIRDIESNPMFDYEFDVDYSVFLSEYTYITENKYKSLLGNCITNIHKSLLSRGISSLKNVYYIMSPSKNGISGGGDIISMELRNMFGRYSIEKNHIIDNYEIYFSGANDDKELFQDVEALVFIDDISGSGTTMVSTIAKFFERLEKYNVTYGKSITVSDICVGTIIGTPFGFDYVEKQIRKKGISVECIAGLMQEKYLPQKLIDPALMIEREKHGKVGAALFDDRYENDEEKRCCRGFENCELIVTFFYETPNNTFPVFWRRTKHFDNPVFPRNGARFIPESGASLKGKVSTQRNIRRTIDKLDKENINDEKG